MPSTRDIRRRIKSVKNTAQITKAMQLVAAAKMKKAQDQAANGRSYAELMNKILVSLKESAAEGVHPYFSDGPGNKTLVLVIATDKGLCGALNTNLIKKLVNTPIEGEVEYVTIGRKASQALSRLRKTLVADFPIKDPARFSALWVTSFRRNSAPVNTSRCWWPSITSSTPSPRCLPLSRCCR